LSRKEKLPFSDKVKGYKSYESEEVTIFNEGSMPTGSLYVGLSDISADAFEIDHKNIDGISVGGIDKFTVRHKTDLDVGNYQATVEVSGTDFVETQSFLVSFSVIDNNDFEQTPKPGNPGGPSGSDRSDPDQTMQSPLPTATPTPTPTPTTKPTPRPRPPQDPSPTPDPTPFPDTIEHWSKDWVLRAQKIGFVAGYPDGLFRPDGSVTRAEFTKMIMAAFNIEETTIIKPDGGESSFTDTAGHWAEPYFKGAAFANLIVGVGRGKRSAAYRRQGLSEVTTAASSILTA
jgi:hypothetical protein